MSVRAVAGKVIVVRRHASKVSDSHSNGSGAFGVIGNAGGGDGIRAGRAGSSIGDGDAAQASR